MWCGVVSVCKYFAEIKTQSQSYLNKIFLINELSWFFHFVCSLLKIGRNRIRSNTFFMQPRSKNCSAVKVYLKKKMSLSRIGLQSFYGTLFEINYLAGS